MFTLVLTVDGEEIFDESEYCNFNFAKEIGLNDVLFLNSLGFESTYEVRCNIAF